MLWKQWHWQLNFTSCCSSAFSLQSEPLHHQDNCMTSAQKSDSVNPANFAPIRFETRCLFSSGSPQQQEYGQRSDMGSIPDLIMLQLAFRIPSCTCDYKCNRRHLGLRNPMRMQVGLGQCFPAGVLRKLRVPPVVVLVVQWLSVGLVIERFVASSTSGQGAIKSTRSTQPSIPPGYR